MTRCGAVCLVAVAMLSGCFTNPRYGAGLAWQSVNPNNTDLGAATQLDVVGRLRCDAWALEIGYGSRVVDYTNDDGGAFAGEIEFHPLGLTWRYLFGAADARLRPSAGLGTMVLTGVEQRIAGVTGVEPGNLFKFVGGLEYMPVAQVALSLELVYEFNATDMTLEKPGYNGVDLDGTALRLGAVYLF